MSVWGVAMRMFSPNTLRKITQGVEKFRRADSKVVAAVASRFGFNAAKTGAETILKAARNNKFMTAIILYEMYGMGNEALQAMFSEDPELQQTLELMDFKQDTVDGGLFDSVTDIVKFEDEFEILKEAAARVGGFNNLLVLRRAMEMNESTLKLYQSTKALKHTL